MIRAGKRCWLFAASPHFATFRIHKPTAELEGEPQRSANLVETARSEAVAGPQLSKSSRARGMADQDLHLPAAAIKRIVKGKLSDVQLSKEALLAFSESAKVFINFLSITANDVCKEKKRQTISADDIYKVGPSGPSGCMGGGCGRFERQIEADRRMWARNFEALSIWALALAL